MGMYFMRSLMKIGAMSFSSLKTSDVLVVKAADAWAPGIVTTDVNVLVYRACIGVFRAKIEIGLIWRKDNKQINISALKPDLRSK